MRKLLAAIDVLVDRPSRIAPGRRSYTDNYTPGADRTAIMAADLFALTEHSYTW
jgi:hypothetical protein